MNEKTEIRIMLFLCCSAFTSLILFGIGSFINHAVKKEKEINSRIEIHYYKN